MSQQITEAMVRQYHGDVELTLQQKGARLRPYVRVEDQKGEMQFHDQIGPTEAVDITNRHGDSPQVDTEHFRRKVTLQFFDWGDFIDRIDRVRILQDPTNAYTQNAAYALGRKMDRILISKFFATAETGKEGTGTESFSGQDVALNLGGTNVGLTVAKILRAGRMLRAAEVDPDDPKYMGVAAASIEDLLNTTEVTSADYNSIKALVKGEVPGFGGFEMVHSELFTKVSTTRSLPAWVKSGMILAIAPDIETAVERRWDKRGAVYVYASAGAGATRTQLKKVVRVECLEA